ncbi:MAG: hypothetical protein JNM25_19435 [Planctomycetes bacterium]|nr:hypothetical protein [Planctomycetota bacterium]
MRRWRLAYAAAWIPAATIFGIGAAVVVAVAVDCRSEVADAVLWIGGIAGAAFGPLVAVGTSRAVGLHRGLRIVAMLAVGMPVATVLFTLAMVQSTRSELLPGFVELVLAVCATAVALCGMALWFAGVCGRQLEDPVTPSAP